jgi:predicted MFS family arabinose efflux permease
MPLVFALTCAMVLLESLFFTALGPLLPQLKDYLGVSASEAGLLASAYVLGAVTATVPAAVSWGRFGVKVTAVVGLGVLAAANLAFGHADTYLTLLAAQFVAGLGAGAMWVAAMGWLIEVTPADRRGEVIGAAVGLTALGEIAGPIIGGVAATAGRGVTYGGIAGLALLLAGVTVFVAGPPRSRQTLGFRTVFSSGRTREAAGLTAIPFLVLGALLVLGTLQLNHLGASPTMIAAAFVAAAVAGVVQGPLVGRWSDRSGRLRPLRFGLLATILLLPALAVAQSRTLVFALVVLTIVAVRFLIAPSVVLLSDCCEAAGGGSALTFLVVMPVTSAGVGVGTAGGGVLAQAVGMSWAYVAVAGVLLAVLVALRKQTDASYVKATSNPHRSEIGVTP